MAIRSDMHGVTLAEFLLVVAIIAILLSAAVPGLGALHSANTLRTHINSFSQAFHTARQQALHQGTDVALCPSRDGSQCDYSADWHDGWLMFADRGASTRPQVDSDQHILLQHNATPGVRIVANRPAFLLRAFGRRSTNGSFTFCDTRGRAAARRLVVSYTGKPRVEAAPSARCPQR